MSLLQNSNAISSGGYTIGNSLRFRSSASAYLNRTPASAGNRKTWTYSVWVKKGALGAYGTLLNGVQSSLTGYSDGLILANGDTIYFSLTNAALTAEAASLVTTAVYRDPSAWYHIVLAVDTTQATASNRIKLYVNGVQVTAFSTANYPTQNFDCTYINTAGNLHQIGRQAATWYLDGYLAEVNFIDGQALTPSSFGQIDALTGVWTAKKYTGTYGTNGFYLPFSNTTSATTLGYDASGNGNNWTANNISTTAGVTYDAMIDSPTLGVSGTRPVGNYAVLNPLNVLNGVATITGGNLNVSSASANRYAYSTIAVPSTGKWYAEVTCTANTNANKGVGLWSSSKNILYTPDGRVYIDGSQVSTPATYTTNDVIGIGFDAGVVTFYKNNTLQYTSSTLTFSEPTFFYTYVFVDSFAWNFGQRPFAYTPPTGFKALCTTNLD